MKNTLHLRSPAKQKNSLQRIIDKYENSCGCVPPIAIKASY
ncbi:hypothetical protein [Microcoleus sp. CAWBG58]|nr:hypothetical protein [Microcoleus sp. CAWBG58]